MIEHVVRAFPQEEPQVRIISNKYPVLTPDGDCVRETQWPSLHMTGYGVHDVVIEHTRHDLQPDRMTTDEVATVIEAWHSRYTHLMNMDQIMSTVIFRNHGHRAGASLMHPHSQIIAGCVVPQHLRLRELQAESWFDRWGRCVICEIIEQELEQKARIVHENEHYVALVPYAASVPFETWIIPFEHRADFGDADEEDLHSLATMLPRTLAILARQLDDPDYNLVINTAARYRSKEPHLHWHIRIRPRMVTRAGFEIGSGIAINPSLPEEDAQYLREGITE
jgi:UDPglucose--hexose-1-phosphate uridylyltransferase